MQALPSSERSPDILIIVKQTLDLLTWQLLFALCDFRYTESVKLKGDASMTKRYIPRVLSRIQLDYQGLLSEDSRQDAVD